jgi:NAD(P)-dependent dehydrogenase (short-subunit alcohol dehydrogenase family)
MAVGLFSLEGKTALVTGGARGLGFACALALLQAGARVIVTARAPEAAEEAARQLSDTGPCEPQVADLATSEGAEALGAEVAQRHDGIDILVNNAGATWGAPLESYPPGAWTKVMQVNVAAPFQVVQSMLALLERRATPDDPARVVNIGSIEGHAAGPYDNYAYGASKAALHHLTRVLARRLAARSITVNCVSPGPIRTQMTAALFEQEEPAIVAATPLRRLPVAADVGAAVVYLTAASGASVTGCVIPVDGGLAINSWGREPEWR